MIFNQKESQQKQCFGVIDLKMCRLNLKGERLGIDQIIFWSPTREVKKHLNSGKSRKRTNKDDLLSLIPQMFFEFLVSVRQCAACR